MNKIYPVDQDNPSADVVNLAATRLRDGGVLVFPTETVYGLGALADQEVTSGSGHLFDIKMRPTRIPIPILVPDASDLDVYGKDVPEVAHKLAEAFWPGALTLVVKSSDKVYKEFRAEDDTIGLRCPDHELIQLLLAACGAPLFATSANTHQLPPPADFDELEQRIIDSADLVLDGGPSDKGVASTIVRCIDDNYEILREGAISREEIEAALA